MPYKCVNCLKLYEDGSKEVLSGCGNCGRKFFFYIRKEKLYEMEQKEEKSREEIEPQEKEKIEKDVREITGLKDEETPVFLDFESVKILRHGKYLLDISKLFTKKPQVYQLEDGKYIIDFAPKLGPEEERKAI